MNLSRAEARILLDLVKPKIREASFTLRNSEEGKDDAGETLKKWVNLSEKLEGIIYQESMF
jgi:hypothetical protein